MPRDPVDAAISFYETFTPNGLAADGLPQFESQVRIRKVKHPNLDITDPATEEDFEQFSEEYAHFLKLRAARATVEGYPLVMWPAIGIVEQQMLAARDIFTVEQLAKLADRRGDMLPQIRELAQRARQMVTLQKDTGKYEAIINDLTQQRDALLDQLREANLTISAQNAQLNRVAAAA